MTEALIFHTCERIQKIILNLLKNKNFDRRATSFRMIKVAFLVWTSQFQGTDLLPLL